MKVIVRRVAAWEHYDWASLISESESEGYRHVGRLADDYAQGVNCFDRTGEVLFVAEIGGVLAGVAGLNRIEVAGAHAIGRVRRVYVSPRYRRHGVGSMLIREILVFAADYYEQLVLRTDNPAADALYQSFGFRRVTDWEDATHLLDLSENICVEKR